jgi:hypothetical protein
VGAVHCESCDRPQSRDWQPGQLCRHCGGPVRIDVRCGACARWTPALKFCRQCAAELVPAEHYGAARMLVQAGVDGLSLAQRVRELDPAQREVFSSRYASQRALVDRLCDEARFAAGFLTDDTVADRLEDDLVASLPWRVEQIDTMRAPPPPRGTDDERLAALRTNGATELTRTLAGLALLRRGRADQELVADAWQQIAAGTPLATEATLALARVAPFVWQWSARAPLAQMRTVAAAAREQRPDAFETTLALAVATTGGMPSDRARTALQAADLLGPLRSGLGHSEPLLRFGTALLLDDDEALDPFVDDADADRAELALRALARRQSPRLLQRLVDADDAATIDAILRQLRQPASAACFDAVLTVLDRGGRLAAAAALRERALRLLLQAKWDDVEPASRAGLARWVATATLQPNEVQWLLEWAVHTDDRSRPYRAASAVEVYADAAARGLGQLDAEALRRFHRIDLFLAIAARPAPRALFRRWLGQASTTKWALESLFHLMSRSRGDGDTVDPGTLELFFATWSELGHDGRLRLAPVLAETTWMNRGSDSFDALRQACWQRMLSHPDERAALWQATASFRDRLEELRDADPRATEIDGGDPARRFEQYSGFDLRSAPELLRTLLDRHDRDPRLVPIGPIAFTRAAELLRKGAHRLGLWLAASWMAGVVNRLRSEPLDAPWRAAAMALPTAHAELMQVFTSSTATDPNDDVSGFVEHMQTELRLADEVFEHERELAERERQRLQEAADRAERKAREQQERHRAEAGRRALLEAEAAAAAAAARAEVAAAAARLAQRSDPQPIDLEVVLPGQPIATLRDYAILIKAMQQGGDVMALFAQRGMSVQAWAACAQAWASLMQRRPELAMRFAQLLS